MTLFVTLKSEYWKVWFGALAPPPGHMTLLKLLMDEFQSKYCVLELSSSVTTTLPKLVKFNGIG